MSARMMQAFRPDQAPAVHEDGSGTFVVRPRPQPYSPPASNYAIEADASAASYFLALPVVTGGKLVLGGAMDAGRGLQGDTEFANVIRAVGAEVMPGALGLEVSFRSGMPRSPIDRNFKAYSDTFLTLAAISPLLTGPTRISGIAHTRKQETDRVAGMARELARIGQHVIETEDALEIHPRPLLAGRTISTYEDHRFAMSFGILGCHDLHGDGRSWLTIANPGCCAKTFRDFFQRLEATRQRSLAP